MERSTSPTVDLVGLEQAEEDGHDIDPGHIDRDQCLTPSEAVAEARFAPDGGSAPRGDELSKSMSNSFSGAGWLGRKRVQDLYAGFEKVVRVHGQIID
jgi:hypothetical protein